MVCKVLFWIGGRQADNTEKNPQEDIHQNQAVEFGFILEATD